MMHHARIASREARMLLRARGMIWQRMPYSRPLNLLQWENSDEKHWEKPEKSWPKIIIILIKIKIERKKERRTERHKLFNQEVREETSLGCRRVTVAAIPIGANPSRKLCNRSFGMSRWGSISGWFLQPPNPEGDIPVFDVSAFFAVREVACLIASRVRKVSV